MTNGHEGRELTVRQDTGLAIVAGQELTRQQVAVVKRTIAQGATDDELDLFLNVARATGLNPFAKELYFVKFGQAPAIIPGIDGLRRKAAESGDYAGQVGPFWCGDDGEWKDVWLSNQPPAAAKVGVIRRGSPDPTWAVVTWREFSRANRRGTEQTWGQKPAHMLAIVAERHALRRACPGVDQLLREQGATTTQDAEWLVAHAEQLEHSEAIPEQPGEEPLFEDRPDDDEPIDGEVTPVNENVDQTTPTDATWLRSDAEKFANALMERSLTGQEARRLLGLNPDAHHSFVMALGNVDEVIKMLDEGLEAELSEDEAERLMS